jgi:S-adenosyl methyltransferase
MERGRSGPPIGTGIPTADNTHEVAQRAPPTARIVYVDNDPIVRAHARALLASGPDGATDYIDADVRNTGGSWRRRRRPWTSASRWRSC